MLYSRKAAVVAMTGALVACGGGGGSSSSSSGGALVAGTLEGPVAGLRYETGTESGMTDASGAFSYREGQQVRFYVGDILVGEAQGAESLTLLDLVGVDAPPVTAREVRATANLIESFTLATPFEVAANIASFLYTLDDDMDASNGIVIPAELHTLAAGRSINFALTYDKFPDHYPLMKLLGEAHLNDIWLQDRPLRKPGYAMDDLYASLGLVPEVSLESERMIDNDNDGVIDSSEQRSYSARGLQTVHWTDADNDGSPDNGVIHRYENSTGFLERVSIENYEQNEYQAQNYSHNSRGLLRSIGYDDDNDGVTDRITRYAYNDYGQVLSSSIDENVDGVIDVKRTLVYDVHGNRINRLIDADNDGAIDARVVFQYDSNNCLTLLEEYKEPGATLNRHQRSVCNDQAQSISNAFDDNGDGIDDERNTIEYNANGQRTRISTDNGADGTVDYYLEYSYNSDGHLTEVLWKDGITEEVFRSESYTLDELGNIVLLSRDSNGDGTPDLTQETTYDLDGSPLVQMTDNDGDGSVEKRIVFSNIQKNGWSPILFLSGNVSL